MRRFSKYSASDTSRMQGGPFSSLGEEGKSDERSKGYMGHGLSNSFSFGKEEGKKKDISCTRSLFLKQTLVVLIYTTACS